VDIRIPEELRTKIPRLGEASEQDDPILWLKFTCEQAGWTWYIIEMQPQGQDAIFYGYRIGWDEELTYFNQSDLELSSAQWGFPIVQDKAFTRAACQRCLPRSVETASFRSASSWPRLAPAPRSTQQGRTRQHSCAGTGAVIGAMLMSTIEQKTSFHSFTAFGCSRLIRSRTAPASGLSQRPTGRQRPFYCRVNIRHATRCRHRLVQDNPCQPFSWSATEFYNPFVSILKG
jgi:hypothetical protein